MERPILVSTDLIKPVQTGLKTETRRLSGLDSVNEEPDKWELIDLVELDGRYTAILDYLPRAIVQINIPCPYGKPGDVLWVRENWFVQKSFDDRKPSRLPVYAHQGYIADGPKPGWAGKTRPSIHMPKDLSRIRLELLDVSIERLHEIKEGAAVREGVDRTVFNLYQDYLNPIVKGDGRFGLPWAKQSFWTLWIKINGQASWDLNPWVWVLKFKRIA